jgi:hypothetical protein
MISEFRRRAAGDPALSGSGCAMITWRRMLLFWLIARFGSLHPAAYFLAAYFGMGLLMVRSFIEHQAAEKANQRSVIIETRGPLSLFSSTTISTRCITPIHRSLGTGSRLLSREPVEVSAHEWWLPL